MYVNILKRCLLYTIFICFCIQSIILIRYKSLFKESNFIYAKYTSNKLPEPKETTTDIVQRIEVLNNHLIYEPSIDWIKDVTDHARKEIVFLRSKLATDKNIVLGSCSADK